MKAIAKPIRYIGTEPFGNSKYAEYQVRSLFASKYFEWRGPDTNAKNTKSAEVGGTGYWHQDCDAVTRFMIVWSNKIQTEVGPLNGRAKYNLWNPPETILPPFPPGWAVLIDNHRAVHRTPLQIVEGREFIRWLDLNNDVDVDWEKYL